MDKKLVQVSDQEVRIQFALNCKCRADVSLTSQSHVTPIAFKVQTSSPHKFLVKPPTGLIPPLCNVTFQIILKPQTQLPSTYPRSPSDKFLIRTAEFTAGDSSSESINHFFSTAFTTHDLKLKVAFVGPLLLRHGVTCGDYDAVRNIIKRQRTILAELPPAEAESLLRVATELVNPEGMINLLLEAGLRIETRPSFDRVDASNGRDEVHVAEARDRFDRVMGLGESGPLQEKATNNCTMLVGKSGVESQDTGVNLTVTNNRSGSLSDAAHDKDKLEMGELLLMAARRGDLKTVEFLLQNGADINCCDQYGLTALHAAAIKGHSEVTLTLIEFGFDLELQDSEGHAPLHLAVVGGSVEVVEMLVENGANIDTKSKSGATPLYMATAMGYDDITEFLESREG